jgi:asparagine synthase (glutamine-hydrolysing)
LKRMNDSLSHRGPDGSAFWCKGSVGLAHQMLWTTPESLHENLPLEANGLIITSDSRIDNRDELLSVLGLSQEVSDSEVILKAYGKWGQDCVDRLLGDFAFVIWDKTKGELFCARDHIGVKPFYYYYQSGKIFAFSTEIKALFAWGMTRRVDEVRVGDYLLNMMEDRERTFYQGITRLPAATYMIVGPYNIKKILYWKLDSEHEIRFGSDEEYEEAFRNIFMEAVRCRLRSAFPIGATLSGGLDSSSVVCMARELMPQDQHLKTFSAIFDIVKECDERPYINAVLAGGQLDAHYIHGDEIGPLDDIERVFWHADEPIWAPNLFLHWAINQEAKSQNVRILLDGIDGDTTVSHGWTYITELAGQGRFIAMLKEARGLSRSYSSSTKDILLQFSLYPFAPDCLIRLRRLFHGQSDKSPTDLEIVNSEFVQRIGLIERKKILQEAWARPARTAREFHWRRLSWGIHQLMFEVTDVVSAAFSIERRSPFFDKRLVEFCLALPANQKMRLGWTRWIMRSALRAILPAEICQRRKKSDLSSNFLHCLLTFHMEALEKVVSDEKGVINSYVSINSLREVHRRLSSQEERLSGDDTKIWLVAALYIWLELLK